MVMKYMYETQVCTEIEANFATKQVKIFNFVKNPIKAAFGINKAPTWEEFEEFLESRCVPRTRDKIKWYLEDISVPFYDPISIIEKTQGKMAEDKFWIKIEE